MLLLILICLTVAHSWVYSPKDSLPDENLLLDAYWHMHCRVVCFLRTFLIDFSRAFALLCVLYDFVFSYFFFICAYLMLKLPDLDICVLLKITQ